MQIKHYLYNAFLVEHGDAKVAIDPGQHLGLFKLRSLIPKSEWASVSHIVVTHGDPDHYWQADRVARTSRAPVICGKQLTRIEADRIHLVAPRGRGLTSWVALDDVHALDVGESVTLDGVGFKAIKTVHGPIALSLFGHTLERRPGPGERVGLGAMGFEITLGDVKVLNLGDTLLQSDWEGLTPDVLMLPIGGLGDGTWTMDVAEALEAVRLVSPDTVIPCHYDVPFLWKRNAAPADVGRFKREVEAMGVECRIMGAGKKLVL